MRREGGLSRVRRLGRAPAGSDASREPGVSSRGMIASRRISREGFAGAARVAARAAAATGASERFAGAEVGARGAGVASTSRKMA